MKSILFVILTMILSAIGCGGRNNNNECLCRTDIACTMEYRTISINVTDTLGNPYSLDVYRTKRLNTGAVYDLQTLSDSWSDSLRRAQGSYPVLDDSYTNSTHVCGESFEFLGYRDSLLVVSQILEIKNNCCHIELISGNTNVTVTQ